MNRHDTLLLTSASPVKRQLLRSVLEESYNLLEANNAQQTRLLLNQNLSCIVAAVVDISTEGTIDPDFAAVIPHVPLILICQEDSPHILNQGFSFGAADVIPLDYDADAMLHRIDTITQLHNHKQYLETMVQEQAQKLQSSNDIMVGALSSIIEYRSVESGQHILRIRHFTKILLEEVRRACPEYQLTDELISVITSASALHDIGKIAIPDAILMKPGKLTAEEWEIMKTHSLTGCQILESLQDMGNEDYLRYAHNICHYHHERWDGKGYPEGLEGENIPICAQVVGLADVYDALTSKRVYKDAYSFDKAVNMILKGECGIFSPKLLECFKHVADQFKDLALSYADGLSPKTETFDVTLPAPVHKEEQDTLNRLQGKYNCLLHYLNCFVIEISVDLGHFHLRYNPYPELSFLTRAASLDELTQLALDQLAIPEERRQLQDLFYQGIEEYLRAGLRRQSYLFHFRSKNGTVEPYDVTLLRANVNQTNNRSLAILCRKLATDQTSITAIPSHNESIVYTLAESTYCCRNDRYFTLVQTGRDTHTLAGYSLEEIHDRFQDRLIELVYPDDRELVRQTFREQLSQGQSVQMDFRVAYKGGHVVWVANKSRLVVDHDGQEYLYSFLTNISKHREASDALQDKLDWYDVILAQTENVLFDWNVQTDTITFSDTWEKIFGFSRISENVLDVLRNGTSIHPDDTPLMLDACARMENGSTYEMVEVRIASRLGHYMWCRFRASALHSSSGELNRIRGIIINIDDEKQAVRALQERAERDSLTKLLNKQSARKQAEEYLAQYPDGVDCAMLIIDLDNFKQVNDQYGHLFGDAVLTQTANAIRKIFRIQDIIARIGGDEFMVFMRGSSDRELLKNRCQRLISSFRQLFQNQTKLLNLSCSIGIALSPEHGNTYYTLFQQADQALYQAKAQGKNQFVFYSKEDSSFITQGLMRTAVSNRIDSDAEPGLADYNLVQYAFQQLYSSRNVSASVNALLAVVGQKMNVSRVYVFENSDDNRFCSNTYEWCNLGISPEIQNLQHLSYETDIPNFEENFDEDGIFYCPDIQDLPSHLYDILAPQGVKSLLHCAIRENGIFRGYIGFDECVTHRLWTKEQIQMLTYFSEMLSVFLLKKREQEKNQLQARELQSILDNQNAWIYIIDPETCQLKYLNAKTKAHSPQIQKGMYCYKALMGTESRCPSCPAANILQKGTNRTVLRSFLLNQPVLSDATLIQWEGRDACLVTCREIPNIP